MEIRKAALGDLGRIMEIYRAAQEFMIMSGNPGQWGRSYPTEEDVGDDIEKGFCHVIYDDTGIHAVFALCEGEDPYYAHIDGAWLNDGEYAAIHRIASDGTFRGVVAAAVGYCREKFSNVRADTHEKNLPMQRALGRCGFVRCGTVYVRDGSPRIAYQLVTDNKRGEISEMSDEKKYPDNKKDFEKERFLMEAVYAGPEILFDGVYAGPGFFSERETPIPFDEDERPPITLVYAGPEYFDRKFRPEDGAETELRSCPVCGRKLEDDYKFCPECGTPCVKPDNI